MRRRAVRCGVFRGGVYTVDVTIAQTLARVCLLRASSNSVSVTCVVFHSDVLCCGGITLRCKRLL
jgi:hypothetical protein